MLSLEIVFAVDLPLPRPGLWSFRGVPHWGVRRVASSGSRLTKTLSIVRRDCLANLFYCRSDACKWRQLIGGTTKQQVQFVMITVQELCESRGGRPGLSVLTSLLVSVDVKIY